MKKKIVAVTIAGAVALSACGTTATNDGKMVEPETSTAAETTTTTVAPTTTTADPGRQLDRWWETVAQPHMVTLGEDLEYAVDLPLEATCDAMADAGLGGAALPEPPDTGMAVLWDDLLLAMQGAAVTCDTAAATNNPADIEDATVMLELVLDAAENLGEAYEARRGVA